MNIKLNRLVIQEDIIVKLIITILCVFVGQNVWALELKQNYYNGQIHQMQQIGTLSQSEAKAQLIKISSTSGEQQNSFKNQVRGVASTMKKIKTHSFQNEAIEIKVK